MNKQTPEERLLTTLAECYFNTKRIISIIEQRCPSGKDEPVEILMIRQNAEEILNNIVPTTMSHLKTCAKEG